MDGSGVVFEFRWDGSATVPRNGPHGGLDLWLRLGAPHGEPSWAMGQLFLRMVQFLLLMDGLQGGWFSIDAVLRLGA